MSKTEFKIDGLKDLQKDFKKLTKAFKPDQVEKASLKSAEIIRAQAERNAPQGPTGNLKRGQIKKLLGRQGGQPAPAIAAVDRKIAPHAHFSEFGTVNMSTKPYFRPAVITRGPEAAKKFREELKKMVDGAVK